MANLSIPNAAWRAAEDAVADVYSETGTRVRGKGAIPTIVNASAPHVVAAELRSHAYRLYQRSDNTLMSRDGSGQERVATLRQIGDELIARAAELDPDGGA